VAPGAIPFGTGGHSAGQGLAPGATALKRTAGGTARATRTYAENSGFMTLVISLRKLGFTDMLEIGLPFGLVAALGAGLASALNGSWPAYVVARILLAARRQLPIRLSSFLDDAYRLGVLRQAGAAYQFRHAILHDYLAAEPQPRPAAERGHPLGEITRAEAHGGSGGPPDSVERRTPEYGIPSARRRTPRDIGSPPQRAGKRSRAANWLRRSD
jgi:hypothetical protein